MTSRPRWLRTLFGMPARRAIIDSEADVGGYPVVTPTQAPFVDDEWDLRFMVRKSGTP